MGLVRVCALIRKNTVVIFFFMDVLVLLYDITVE